MDTVVILDTETDGVGPDARVIEVAVCLYSLTHAAPIRSFASLIRAESNAAEHVNRIPAALLADAPEPGRVWPLVARMATAARAIVAHNADFDRRFVPAEVWKSAGAERWSIDGDGERVMSRDDIPWVCSMNDLAWPFDMPGASLINLALAHGLGVATAHRAAADVDLLARMFTRAAEMGADLEAMMARGLRPKSRYQALVSFETNALAREAGFKWDPAMKVWARNMADDDTAGLPFKVRRLGS